jgi:hypothetical protein
LNIEQGILNDELMGKWGILNVEQGILNDEVKE